ncbi:MAG: carbohydrate ABC transporter permease [Bacillota bacterium]
MNSKIKKTAIDIAAFILLSSGAVTMLFPFLWMVSTSLKHPNNVHMFPPQWIPDPVIWRNYIDIWTIAPLLSGIKNSAIVTFATLFIGTFSTSISAFAFAKMRFPHKQKLLQLILIMIMIPPVSIIIPQFIGFSKIGLTNTLWPLILPGLFGNVSMLFFLRQYMLGLSSELMDAGKIDGCNYFGIYSRIFLPNCKPALAANTIMWFMGLWNEFFGSLIYLNSPNKFTIQLVIATLHSYYASQTNFPIIMASSVVAILPVMIVFIAFQKYFTESFALTGIKG